LVRDNELWWQCRVELGWKMNILVCVWVGLR
jgi:hypothetical protein